MSAGNMMLEILSPEKSLFKGEASHVSVPGSKAPFVILYNHAPIISKLDKGSVVWDGEDGRQSIDIEGGFLEACGNYVTICIETVK